LPNIVSGLKFSWPIYKSGFHVLIASAVEEGGIWAFAQVRHLLCPGGGRSDMPRGGRGVVCGWGFAGAGAGPGGGGGGGV
jgi:hypothetical protein